MHSPIPYGSYYSPPQHEQKSDHTPQVISAHPLPKISLLIGDFLLEQSLHLLFREALHLTIAPSEPHDKATYFHNWLQDSQVIPFYHKSPIGRGKRPNRNSIIASTAMAQRLFPHSTPSTLSQLPIGAIQQEIGQELDASHLCYLEGGNILFWNISTQEPNDGAFIGAFSVIFSLQKMREKQYFTNERLEECRLRSTKFPHPIPKLTGASDEEQERFSLEWILTIEQIAQTLHISSVTNLIVLEHGMNLACGNPVLHIDLMLLVGPDRTIFLDDPKQNVTAWKKAYEPGSKEREQWGSYFNTLQPRAIKAQIVFENNRTLLLKRGFTVVGLPGLMTFNTAKIGGQFLNGLLVHVVDRNKYLLLSTPITSLSFYQPMHDGNGFITLNNAGYQTHRLAEVFFDAIKQSGVDVVFCSPNNAKGGGVHCLSRVQRLYSNAFPCQFIPVNHFSLSTKISTYIELLLQNLTLLESKPLTIYQQLGSTSQETAVTFINRGHCHQSLIELHVPLWQERATWRLSLAGKLIGPSHRILPGHPQQLLIDPWLTPLDHHPPTHEVIESSAETLLEKTAVK